jgi:GrpB-like predicted nucleotidyltransferase (UPF0157 family)
MRSVGLKRGTVQLVPYNPEWPELFEQEKQLLQETLGSHIINIEHVGSTAVPGLSAKPIIDIIASVGSFSNLDDISRKLQALGYEYMPERMFADRKFFPKGPRHNRTHHLNIVLKDSASQWQDILLFRNYLRGNSGARESYQLLKQTLGQQYANDRQAYTTAKAGFIQDILQKSRSTQ